MRIKCCPRHNKWNKCHILIQISSVSRLKVDFRSKLNINIVICSSQPYIKVLMQYCPCRVYRQLDSIIQPSNYIPKSSNIISSGSVIKVLVIAGNLKVGTPMLCCLFYQTQHRHFQEKHLLFYKYANFLKSLFVYVLIWNERATSNVRLLQFVLLEIITIGLDILLS